MADRRRPAPHVQAPEEDRRHLPDRRAIPRGGRRATDTPGFQDAFEAASLAVSEDVDAIRLAKGWSVDVTAERAGLSDRGLLKLLKTQSDPRLSTLVKLARAFGVSVKISFRREL